MSLDSHKSKAANTWARYLPSNLLEIVKTAFLLIYKKMLLPPNVRERERELIAVHYVSQKKQAASGHRKIEIKKKFKKKIF